MEYNTELIEKVKAAQSAEELMRLAKENGMELSEEKAEEYFLKLNQMGELSDNELDNVAGGCFFTYPCRYCGSPIYFTYIFCERCNRSQNK